MEGRATSETFSLVRKGGEAGGHNGQILPGSLGELLPGP